MLFQYSAMVRKSKMGSDDFLSNSTGCWGMAVAREAWPNVYIANLIILIL